MFSSIKTKIALGIGGLFILLLTIGIIAFVSINVLSDKTENLLTANYKSIQYCNMMMHAVDMIKTDSTAKDTFEHYLQLQEANITETGEGQATYRLRTLAGLLKTSPVTEPLIDSINRQLFTISIVNQHALDKKNYSALDSAQVARLWISTLGVIILLLGFSIAMSFPGYISKPVKILIAGIKEIGDKNYSARIYLDNKDEFGEMAKTFNAMAERLYQFENSNLAQLMFEKKRIEAIINQMEDAVIGIDAAQKILFVNHNAEKVLSIKGEDVIGKYVPDVALNNDFLHLIMREQQNDVIKIMANNKESYFTLDRRNVSNDGVSLGEVYSLKNITHFKELDISKTNLLATISHELKTPISSIKLSAKLLMDKRTGVLNNEQQELAVNIMDDGDRLLRITSELLNITQIETGNIQLKLQTVNTDDIINIAVQSIQLLANQKNINLKVDTINTSVLADADKTSWVLINLLTNAIKHSSQDSTVIIKAGLQNNRMIFSVKDSGTGIDEKYIAKIFERYFKIPGGADDSGTGLGLAISKEFIEAQGGHISAISDKGKGAIFSFDLPVNL